MDKPKIEVVPFPLRQIIARWSGSDEELIMPAKRKKPETQEEEADEIIYRLKSPPAKPRSLEDEISEELAKIIQEEIDKELLEEMLKCQKKQKK